MPDGKSSTIIPAEEIKTYVLDHLQVGVTQSVGSAFAASVDAQVHRSIVGDGLLYQLTGYLQADHLCDETKDFFFHWPRSRWQAFKLRHPGRFARRFPVKYFTANATVEVKSWATFPQSEIVEPKLGQPLYIQQMSTRSIADPAWKLPQKGSDE